MANTQRLLDLIDEFGPAFADPEFSETIVMKKIEGKEEEEEVEQNNDFDLCYYYISRLEYEPYLMKIATSFLGELADVASIKQQLYNEPIRRDLQGALDDPNSKLGAKIRAKMAMPDLPETFARQGTEDCPSGACPVDY